MLLNERWGRPMAVTPSGVVVHMTRCGSTLMLNALRAAEGTVGLSEAQPLAVGLGLLSSRSRDKATLGEAVSASLVNLFATYHGGDAKHIIIKCDVAGATLLRGIRRLWPRVPCLMLIRDPAEVVASNLEKPPRCIVEWYQAQRHGPRPCPVGVPPPEACSNPQEFCAWALGRVCEAAGENLDETTLVIDYTQLSPELALSIGARFGLRFSKDGEQELRNAFGRYSKVPNRPFLGDGEHKARMAVSNAVQERAERWVSPHYERLRAACGHRG